MAATCGSCKRPNQSVEHIRACSAGHNPLPTQQPIKWPSKRPSASPASVTHRSQDAAKVPAGYYAVGADANARFYRVTTPTEGRWAGYTFIDRISGDNQIGIRNRDERLSILSMIKRAGVAESMARYGQLIGQCGKCHRQLTDEVSRRRGIGPDCWKVIGGTDTPESARRTPVAPVTWQDDEGVTHRSQGVPTETVDCDRCGGTGRYRWGAIVNGKATHEGPCYRCEGKGKQTVADQKRNYGYDNFAIRSAFAGMS